MRPTSRTPYFESLLSNFSSNMEPKDVPKWSRNRSQMPLGAERWRQSRPKDHPNPSQWATGPPQGASKAQNGAKMEPKWPPGLKKMVPKRSQNMPKWSPNGTQTVSTRVKNNENRTQLVSETRETTKPCRNNETHRTHETPKLWIWKSCTSETTQP